MRSWNRFNFQKQKKRKGNPVHLCFLNETLSRNCYLKLYYMVVILNIMKTLLKIFTNTSVSISDRW